MFDVCFGNFFDANDFTFIAIVVVSFHFDQVDFAFVGFAFTDWQLNQDGVGAQFFSHLLNHAKRVGSSAIHLVDERKTRNFVTLHLTIDRQRLSLHTTDGTQNQNGSVEYSQRTLNFNREVNVARRINQVNGVAIPLNLSRGTGDRDPTLFLKFHVIHGGTVAAATDLFDFVDTTCVEQDSLTEGRLARVNMS